MAKPIYNEKITRATDWGGDASTDNMPVSGARVQEYIKGEFTSLESGISALDLVTKNIQKDVTVLQTNSTTQGNKLDGLASTMSGHTSAIQALAEENQTQGESISSQGNRIAGLERKTDNHDQTLFNLTPKVDANSKAITALQGNVDTLGTDKADKSMFVVLSDTEYDALEEKDSNAFYYIYEDE